MDPAPSPADRPTEPVPRRRDERRAIPVDMDAHQAWATGLFRHVHRTLLGSGAVIIEGLNLSEVDPGDYELICLPLKIEGGDGAPARVVLRG